MNLVSAAGAAVVYALATDGSRQAEEAVVALWRQIRPEGSDGESEENLEPQLSATRERLLAARREADPAAEHALTEQWQERLWALIPDGTPGTPGDLDRADEAGALLWRLLQDTLKPLLHPADLARVEALESDGNGHGTGPGPGNGIQMSVSGPETPSSAAPGTPVGTPLTPDDPQRLGDYWTAARLGTGGQGTVYEAYDVHGRRVALKVLHRDAGQFVRDRFGKEVVAAQRVASFCTARILDASLDEDPPFIVSEYVPGPTLSSFVRDLGPLADDSALRLATGVATALAAIHQVGVVHRDLKPGNVLLGPDGPRVIDFGIARAPDMSLTATGAIMGTLGYMAPEVLSGQRASSASDIFAWGALVLYATTGTEPFRGDNIAQVAHRTATVDPDLSELPERLRPLVAAALSKEPGARPSATDLLLGLVGLVGGAPKAADPTADQAADAGQALLEAGVSRAAVPQHEQDGATLAAPDLGERSEQAYTAFPPAARGAARELLLRLVVPGDAPDGSQDTVRTAAPDELFGDRPEGEDDSARYALAALCGVGALVVGQDGSVRPVGAALLRAWPRLREWTDADRAGLPVRHRVGQAARQWRRGGERADDLLHGSALRTAFDWSVTAPAHLRPNALEQRFLAASRQAGNRLARRRRQFLSGLAVLVVATLVASGLAWQQRQENERQEARTHARSVAQAADRLRASEPSLAMLLSIAAWRLAESEESRAAVYAAAGQREVDAFVMPWTNDEFARHTHLTPDGRFLLTDLDDRLEVWDVRKKQRTYKADKKGDLKGVTVPAVSADGRTLAFHLSGGRVQLMDTEKVTPKGEPIRLPSGHYVADVSNDGKVLLGYGDASEPGFQLWRTSPRAELVTESTTADISTLSPDGRSLAACASGGLELRSLAGSGARAVAVEDADLGEAACTPSTARIIYSPDGSRLAVGRDSLYLWNARSGASTGSTDILGPSPVFSSDGRFLVAHSEQDGVTIMSAQAATSLSQPVYRDAVRGDSSGDRRTFTALAVNSEDKQLVSVMDNGTVQTMDISGALDEGWGGDAYTGALSADGRLGMQRLTETDGRQQIFDVATGKRVGDPIPDPGSDPAPHWAADFDHDGSRLAFYTFDKDFNPEVTVWGVRDRKVLAHFPVGDEESGVVASLTLSPDGRRVAVGVSNEWRRDVVEVYDATSGKRLHRVPRATGELRFSPDGKLLVSTDGDVIDLTTGKHRRNAFGNGLVFGLAFSPDGTRLAVTRESGWVELWDGGARTLTGRLASDAVLGGERAGSGVGRPAFSPDGRYLAAQVGEGWLQLWDTRTRLALGDAMPTSGQELYGLAFDDSVTLRLLGHGSLAQSLTLDPEKAAALICRRVGRDITRTEWRTYIPNAPYRSLCPQGDD